ncbi:hypothetical protein K469DRAFT_162509 [Zopfia rhizophila CBS 207.26]|uniref:Uncharacterized protein n=1 Tax=Zopfia rhizophila CBS 207.26 TaxID=1314779 RepID=A0A6A6E362_9PEZI|nr:hypothetical protein K469DRAFT_162509 [Zopfia rhizophila CBS 207.26]
MALKRPERRSEPKRTYMTLFLKYHLVWEGSQPHPKDTAGQYNSSSSPSSIFTQPISASSAFCSVNDVNCSQCGMAQGSQKDEISSIKEAPGRINLKSLNWAGLTRQEEGVGRHHVQESRCYPPRKKGRRVRNSSGCLQKVRHALFPRPEEGPPVSYQRTFSSVVSRLSQASENRPGLLATFVDMECIGLEFCPNGSAIRLGNNQDQSDEAEGSPHWVATPPVRSLQQHPQAPQMLSAGQHDTPNDGYPLTKPGSLSCVNPTVLELQSSDRHLDHINGLDHSVSCHSRPHGSSAPRIWQQGEL